MERVLSILLGIAVLATLLFLTAYVTWLFAVRVRKKESVHRSFYRWLRDLFDLSQVL